jgi:amidase
VAAGLGVLDLGSDLSGSLRVPASWCGLFGHRPSNGLVSKLGHMPWPQGGRLEPMVSVVGPLVRSAADLGRVMDVIVGLEGDEATAFRIELPPTRVGSLDGCRVGVWIDDPACRIDTETRHAIRAFADALSDSGAMVEELAGPPSVGGDALELFLRLCAGEIAHGLDDEAWAFARSRAASDSTSPSAAQARRYHQPLREALDDFEEQRATMARWRKVFESTDVVLCPATPRVATPHSDEPRDTRTTTIDDEIVESDVIFEWSCLSSIGKLPATVVPVGLGARSGLPVGAQLLGPFLEDRTPIRVAELAEAEGLIEFVAPPGF